MTGELSPDFCIECGEPLDDFSPCACALAPRRPPARAQGGKPKPGAWSMRNMVDRKLVRQGKR